jgi:hypothetical protein
MNPVPDGDKTRIQVPAPLITALAISAVVVVAVGVYPQTFAHFGDLASLVP